MVPDPDVVTVEPPLVRPRRRVRAVKASDLALLALAGLFFLVLSYLPLRPAVLWGDLNWGDWILSHRSLPAADPVLLLAEGMPVVDGAWLSQALLAAVDRAAGSAGLSTLFAITAVATLLLLGRTFYRQTGSRLWSLFGVIAALAISWGPATVFSPQSFGALCFAALLWLATGADEAAGWRWREGLGVAVLFVLWANFHASFLYGLAVLACGLLGRLLEVLWQSRSLGALLADRPLRRQLFLSELAVAATLINPYGIDLLVRALWLPPSSNLRDLPGWQPLQIAGVEGWAFAASVVLLLFALRHSRRPMPASHALLLAFFGGAAVLYTGMLAWYGPVFALVTVPHLADLAARLGAAPAGPVRRAAAAVRRRIGFLAGPSWHYSLLALLVVWAIGALSPLGASLLRGTQAQARPPLPPGTPVELAAYLRSAPPRGLLFNPLEWGDFLVREGPPGLRPFATSRVEQIPARVWRDYGRITGGEASWPRILDRYNIDTVIFDRIDQREQARTLRNSGEWRVIYEDSLAVVFARGAGGAGAAHAHPHPHPHPHAGEERP